MHLPFGEGSRLAALLQSVFYLVGVPIFLDSYYGGSNQTLSVVSPAALEPGQNDTLCYDPLGCFKIRHPDRKGYNMMPNPLDEVIPTICLYIKPQIHTCQVVEREAISDSALTISNGSSFWIAHGYIKNGQRPWIREMVKELLDYDIFANVFVIDWSEASKPPYNQAVENVEMVAAYCADLMGVLEKTYGLPVDKTHFIGHSLGAQLGGYLGSWLQEKKGVQIGRISGLDPAQLYFEGLPTDARLDPLDADFVDVIHTDAKPFLYGGEIGSKSTTTQRPVSGLGTQEPSGHADFFPNGGKDQPGCKDGVYQAILQEEGSVINGIRRFLGCDHIRSYEYFTESIRSPCPFMAFGCDSWKDLAESSCTIAGYNKLGFHARKPAMGGNEFANSSQVFYSITGPRPPFCREHYKVIIELGQESKYHSTSELHLVLGKNNGNANEATITVLNLGAIDFTGPDLTKKHTVSGVNNGFPDSITLRPSSSNPLRWLMTKMATPAPSEPDVVVANVTLFHLEREGEHAVFCPVDKNYFSATEQNPGITFRHDHC